MPQNKNQHFVPRSYLKRFANLTNRKAISLYNFRSRTYVAAAPLRGQCSKDYLYGNDPRLEKLLGELEGDYSRVSEALISDESNNISGEDTEHLRMFLVIQMFRTVQAIEKTRDQFRKMHDLMFHDIEDAPSIGDMSEEHLVIRNVELALKFYRGLTDLRLTIARNKTDLPLFTSDSPAVSTNRLFLQRYKIDNFGLGQSGAILYLPLSPTTGAIFYDQDVYTAKTNKNGSIDLSERDIRALNRLITLEARQNIYYQGDLDSVRTFISEVRSDYSPRWNSAAVFAPDLAAPDSRTYSRVANDHRQEGSMLYVTTVHYPDPREWIGGLSFRANMVGYTNGSAVGYVRRHTAANDGQPVWRVNLRTAKLPPAPTRDDGLRWKDGAER